MARLWSSGFELDQFRNGGSIAALEWEDSESSGAVSTTGALARSGARSLFINGPLGGTPDDVYYRFATDTSTQKYYIRTYLRVHTRPNAENTVIGLDSLTGTFYIYITLDSGGLLRLYDEDGQIGSASSALTNDTWYRIELGFDVTAAGGSHVVTAKIDGSNFATASNRNISNDPIALHLGANIKSESDSASVLYFDDVAINDDTGSFQNSYPGSGRIVHLKPNAAGDNSDWTNTYTNVNEIKPDDGTTIVSSNTLNQIDDHNLDYPVYLTSSDTISVVQVGCRYRGAGASLNATFQLRIEASASGTIEASSNITPSNATWVTNANASPFNYALTLYDLPGASTTAWTPADLVTAQIGYKLTIIGTNAVEISTAWLLVEYVDAGTVSNDLLTNLISYWKMNEFSDVAYDAKGTNDLTDNNTVTSKDHGIIGPARQFTSANTEYLSIADNASLSMGGSQDFSISAWVYPDTLPAAATIIGKDDGSSNREYTLYTDNTGKVTFQLFNTGGNDSKTTTGTITSGAWHHIVATYSDSGNQIAIYIDGATAETATANNGARDGASEFDIGRQQTTFYWNGQIDEVGLWKRTLSSAEVTTLYNSGNGFAYEDFTVSAATTSSSTSSSTSTSSTSTSTSHSTSTSSTSSSTSTSTSSTSTSTSSTSSSTSTSSTSSSTSTSSTSTSHSTSTSSTSSSTSTSSTSTSHSTSTSSTSSSTSTSSTSTSTSTSSTSSSTSTSTSSTSTSTSTSSTSTSHSTSTSSTSSSTSTSTSSTSSSTSTSSTSSSTSTSTSSTSTSTSSTSSSTSTSSTSSSTSTSSTITSTSTSTSSSTSTSTSSTSSSTSTSSTSSSTSTSTSSTSTSTSTSHSTSTSSTSSSTSTSSTSSSTSTSSTTTATVINPDDGIVPIGFARPNRSTFATDYGSVLMEDTTVLMEDTSVLMGAPNMPWPDFRINPGSGFKITVRIGKR